MRQLFKTSLLVLTMGAAALCADDPHCRARNYSQNSQIQREWAACVMKDLQVGSSDKILDYGCRDGRILALLRHRAPEGQLVGFEDDAELLTWSLAKYPRALTGIEWTDTLPNENGSFDLIYSVNRLYREEDAELTLNRLHSLLKPGGKLYIVGPGGGNINAMSKAFQTVISRLGIEDAGQASIPNPKYRYAAYMKHALENAGFHVLRAKEKHSIARFHDRAEAIAWTVGSLGIAWNLPTDRCQAICELAFEELVQNVQDSERPDGSLVLPMWRLELIAERN